MHLTLYPCPCCGYRVFDGPPGTFEFCPVCIWQDDLSQLRFITSSGGANEPSLVDAQQNYLKYGVSDAQRQQRARFGSSEVIRDKDWRLFDFAIDNVEISNGEDQGGTYPPDRTVLYYWRETYWRR